MTYIEKMFTYVQYNKNLQTDPKLAALYRLYMSLTEDTRLEIDEVYHAVAKQKIRNTGFLSNFELAIKLLMFRADAALAKEIFVEMETLTN